MLSHQYLKMLVIIVFPTFILLVIGKIYYYHLLPYISLDKSSKDYFSVELATVPRSSSTNTSAEHREKYGPSLLPAEIERVLHFPNQAKIIVKLVNKRRCVKPRLVGRLSGPALSLIEWEKNNNPTPSSGDNTTVRDYIVGYYNVPSPGRYFIEIIGILCNDLAFDTNFTGICLEDPTRHRITDPSAYIDVTAYRYGKDNNRLNVPLGYWKSSKDIHYPLFTRFQPQDCRDNMNSRTNRCLEASSTSQFTPYHFVYMNEVSFNDKENIYSRAKHLDEANDKTKFCLVGASHSISMCGEMNNLLRRWNISNVKVYHKESKYPHTTDIDFITQNIITQNCNKTVIAVGQWPAYTSTLFQKYKIEVVEMISRFRDLGVNNFYMRDIHYNSLGDVKTTCPPRDWRSPPVIDGYNAIISNVSAAMNVPFLNTKFIIGPMWDSAKDFCHYSFSSASRVEALYMLGRLL